MRRNLRPLRAAFAGAIVLALGAAPALAADPAKAQLPASPSARVSATAKILVETNVYAQPAKHIKLRLATHAQWGGGPHVLLVLDSRMYKGKAWLRVALPDRPNGSSGWIREDFVRLGTTPWRITVNRAAHVVTVYRDGRKQRSFGPWSASLDAHAARPLRGLREARAADPKGFYGPWVCTSRPSRTCSSTLAAVRAGWRSTAVTARVSAIRSAPRARTGACASTTRTSPGWRTSSRSARLS